MRWRHRLFFVLAFAAFGAVTMAAQPYWDAAVRSPESLRGRRAREARENDTRDRALRRAALGAAFGLGAGLLAFTVRKYRPGSGRRLHWTGLEIEDRPAMRDKAPGAGKDDGRG